MELDDSPALTAAIIGCLNPEKKAPYISSVECTGLIFTEKQKCNAGLFVLFTLSCAPQSVR